MLQNRVYLHDSATPLTSDGGWVEVNVGGYYNWHATGDFNGTTATLLWARDKLGTDSDAIEDAVLDGTVTAILEIPISAGFVKVDFSGTPTSVVSYLAGLSR